MRRLILLPGFWGKPIEYEASFLDLKKAIDLLQVRWEDVIDSQERQHLRSLIDLFVDQDRYGRTEIASRWRGRGWTKLDIVNVEQSSEGGGENPAEPGSSSGDDTTTPGREQGGAGDRRDTAI